MASRWATTRSARRAASVPTIPSRVEPNLVSQGKPRKYSAINLRCAVVVIELPTDDDTGTSGRLCRYSRIKPEDG